MNRRVSFFIRLPYWLGIAADALWAAALLFPSLYGRLAGRAEFVPDLEVRLIMSIGGILMLGWTLLLIWGVQKPVERRFIILLTAFPVVAGMFIVSLIGYTSGNSLNLWIVAKTALLFLSMMISFFLARKVVQDDSLYQ